ncbi:MFS transporter [Candidatus Desulfovibrio trichonymphae]|uniref:MFS transporter n=1 Tax=Candidatus Desulfovibrio trichonymphae TaxID=1725232 RepID=UPI001E324C86|nr:MFS transporter [Candidatus Desulfovibrio trichonymphae]
MRAQQDEKISFRVLISISFAHCLNDTTQFIIIALYPFFKTGFNLSFTELGFLSFAYQMCASVLQPIVGYHADRRPQPYSLPAGMTFTLLGILFMAFSTGYVWLLVASVFLGAGSAVFHPESSRVAYMASAGQYGLAQSIFQVGGNAGQAIGPLIAALFVVTARATQSCALCRHSSSLHCLSCLYKPLDSREKQRGRKTGPRRNNRPAAFRVQAGIGRPLCPDVLKADLYRKYCQLLHLFSDQQIRRESGNFPDLSFSGGRGARHCYRRTCRRPHRAKMGHLGLHTRRGAFALALPYAGLVWTAVLIVLIGFIMASSFSAILVFAQELVPGHIGAVAGLFFGLAFGLGGIGAAVLGKIADSTNIDLVYTICSFLPLVGLLTFFLPGETRKMSKR